MSPTTSPTTGPTTSPTVSPTLIGACNPTHLLFQARVWDLEHGYYGTDQGLVAISAARLGRAADAVHFAMLVSVRAIPLPPPPPPSLNRRADDTAHLNGLNRLNGLNSSTTLNNPQQPQQTWFAN